MVVVVGLAFYLLGFWVPTIMPRSIGVVTALVLLGGCVALVVTAAQHVPSRTHFDIAREAGTATGVFFATAPIVAILFLARVPQAERRTGTRLPYLVLALCLGAAAGFLTFSFAFPGI
ncbi:hypothetical protein [Jannaschia marina]|uniref:hypothetical protein n=1 Tax=Jannaschia marina TaxID=2741674 RepID=UPI0015C6BCCB|nr:hypothetical protein [Jannaschia marina]